jgi:hypothetical protein
LAGLSYSDITYVLRFAPCIHEFVELWVKLLEQVDANVEAEPKHMIPVDKNKIKADGEYCHVP